MICGGINTAGSGPVCRSYAANEIIDTFDSRAANANRAYKSDYEAEANIEIHYQEAYQKLNALHLGKTD